MLWCLTAFMMLSTAVPAESLTAGRKTLRCGWYLWDPYQYTVLMHDIKHLTGLDVQLVKSVFEHAGYEVLYEEVSWKQHQLDIKEGRRDIAAGAFYNEDRASYAYYSTPYRTETDVLYVRKPDAKRFSFSSTTELISLLDGHSVRLGIIDGFYYGPELMNYIHDPANASRIIRVGNDVANFENLLDDKIDAFVIDRLVGATLAWRHGWQRRVVEIPQVVFSESIHVIFSKETTSPELVEQFNASLDQIRKDGRYNKIVREYLLPVLLGATAGQRWFFVVDIIGTIAFAVSGVLLAKKGHYSLFGALVLASLPAVGGGIMRDVLINRETPAVLTSPIYVLAIFITVLVGYIIFRIRPYGVDAKRALEPSFPVRISSNTAITFFDALGLAAFTVIGVIVAVENRCQPLLLWGPLLAALTGAGGGIIRDVIRADADNPGLKGTFYAEVALIWGFLLSIFLTWYANSLVYHPAHISFAVIGTMTGALLTRMIVYHLRIRSPMY